MSKMSWREFDRDPIRHRIRVDLDHIRRRLNDVLEKSHGSSRGLPAVAG